MNPDNLHQIFSHYIDRFEFLNSFPQEEYYKWQIAKPFRTKMDEALAVSDETFPEMLRQVKKLTYNFIDSSVQPFQALIEFAEKEPKTVRDTFLGLFSAEPGNVQDVQKKVSAFLEECHELKEKYEPDSWKFKNTVHSATAFLFLYDPDHNYVYKPTQSKTFADCVGYFDDWGDGDGVKLEVYYRMCDQLVEAIKADSALMETDRSRFSNGWGADPASFHPDTEKHILAFDIIHCCLAYGLYDGLSFERINSKERQILLEKQNTAQQLKKTYEQAKARYDQLTEARMFVSTAVKAGDTVEHKSYGKGIVISVDDDIAVIEFTNNGQKKMSITTTAKNRIVDYHNEELSNKAAEYEKLLRNANEIEESLKRAERDLKPYLDFI